MRKAREIVRGYPERVATLGICAQGEEYLLLRIDRDWKFCPGDWDFVIATFVEKRESPELNALVNTSIHTGLSAEMIVSYPILRWPDHESRILFVLYPCLMRVERKSLCLSRKFCEAQWVTWERVLEYDRNEYLASVVSHIRDHGGP